MVKVNWRKYCDREEERDNQLFCCLDSRGKAVVCSVAYPTENSRSAAACGKMISISSESFLRRPSLKDVAMETISTFMNEGIYILQEPGKEFLCSGVILYMFQRKVRMVVTGMSVVYHFQDGQLADCFLPETEQLFGQRMAWKQKAEEEIDLSKGSHIFLLYSGQAVPNIEITKIENLLQSNLEETDFPVEILSDFEDSKCAVCLLAFPKRKRRLLSSI